MFGHRHNISTTLSTRLSVIRENVSFIYARICVLSYLIFVLVLYFLADMGTLGTNMRMCALRAKILSIIYLKLFFNSIQMQICCGDSGDAGVDGITTSHME